MKKMMPLYILTFLLYSTLYGQDITRSQAFSTYSDYLYYGGSSLSPEEIKKYLVEPLSEALHERQATTDFVTRNIAKNDRYDEARKKRALEEWNASVNQDQVLVSHRKRSYLHN